MMSSTNAATLINVIAKDMKKLRYSFLVPHPSG
jgi:hypothetical protein